MTLQIKRIILLFELFCLAGQLVFSQSQTSKDNYTGAWETSTSWNPTWAVPQTVIDGFSFPNITINGYITVNGNLTFSGLLTNLIINDTLVINGDLLLDNFNNLTVNGNGILIIMGNFYFNNNAIIITNNYIVVTDNIYKGGPLTKGSFISNSNPTKVFVGGTVFPTNLTDNLPNYPALNCLTPTTTQYPSSACSHGNIIDLFNDPINTFLQSTCTMTAAISITDNSGIANNDGIICNGSTATLTASGGTSYSWSSGETTAAITKGIAGTYTVTVTNANVCTSTKSAAITVNALPLTPTITADGSKTFCAGGSVTLNSSAGTSYLWSTGATTSSINVTTAENYTIRITNASGCQSISSLATTVIVNELPIAIASNNGPVFTRSAINLTGAPAGMTTYTWTGPGGFVSSSQSPLVSMSALAAMAGVYTLTVTNDSGCADTDTTTVKVNALPVPSVITPNDDGKNDYFVIGEIIDQVEIIIFNRWGNEVYKNGNYQNDWVGRNNKGNALPGDTYFYILKFKDGTVKKGSVLIKR